MKQLPERFRKNGLDYHLIRRTDLVALYELTWEGENCGWEVSRIFTHGERTLNGRTIEAAEALPSNEKFGTEGLLTKSQAFHSANRKKAEEYFTTLSDRLRNPNRVDTYEKLGTFSSEVDQSAALGATSPMQGIPLDTVNKKQKS